MFAHTKRPLREVPRVVANHRKQGTDCPLPWMAQVQRTSASWQTVAQQQKMTTQEESVAASVPGKGRATHEDASQRNRHSVNRTMSVKIKQSNWSRRGMTSQNNSEECSSDAVASRNAVSTHPQKFGKKCS